MSYEEWKFPPLEEAKMMSEVELREEISIAEEHLVFLEELLEEKENK